MKKIVSVLVAVSMIVLLVVPVWSEEANVSNESILFDVPPAVYGEDEGGNDNTSAGEQTGQTDQGEQTGQTDQGSQTGQTDQGEQGGEIVIHPDDTSGTEGGEGTESGGQQETPESAEQTDQTGTGDTTDYEWDDTGWSDDDFGDWTGDNDDGAAAALAEELQEQHGDTQSAGEPGLMGGEPASLTVNMYGYDGVFDAAAAVSEQVDLTEGEWDINDAQMLVSDGTVIRNAGTSSLVVRNCYVRGETAEPTVPLEGSGMLVSGSIRATLAMENSESIYLNSSIISRNWSALSTDSALPAEEGRNPLSLYLYGSEAITIDGGYGAYSDNLCSLYSYGSHIQAAEIGIVSGNYGAVTIGAIEDGEQDPAVSAVLTQDDRDRQPGKELGSIIDAGRNALMVYSQDSPELSARITARGSILRTVLGLDKNVQYAPEDQAYLNHTKGSVILVKSTNAEVILNKCEMLPDLSGTGYLVQTVYSNDTGNMNDVPDGELYPGVSVALRGMRVAGDIAHEDYQRDMNISLSATALDGAVNEYDWQHWSRVAAEEGFLSYAPEAYYETHHGVAMALQEGSVWNVTGESHLSKLMIGADCQVNGTILIDGVEQPNAPGSVYEGAIIVIPLVSAEEQPAAEEPVPEQPVEEQPAA